MSEQQDRDSALSLALAVCIGIVVVLLFICWRDNLMSRRKWRRRQCSGMSDTRHDGAPDTPDGMREGLASDGPTSSCGSTTPTGVDAGAHKVVAGDYDDVIKSIALGPDVAEGHSKYLAEAHIPTLVPNRNRQETDHSIDSNFAGIGAIWMRKEAVNSGALKIREGERQTQSVDYHDMNW
jgi:hypothetical protein